MIESEFYSILTGVRAVTSQIGNRVYPMDLPDAPTLPAITYSVISGTPSPTFDTRGLERLRIEVNCWGTSYSDAVTLRNAVIQGIDGYNADGVTIRYLSRRDFFDHEARQYRAMAEFYIFAAL